jgi:hypothetical protein
MAVRKRNPWTLLRKRLTPIVKELHEASPWRVVAPATVEEWLMRLTWYDLLEGDMICEQLCQEPPQLNTPLFSLTLAGEEGADGYERQLRLIQQVMHRLVFALDLCTKMAAVWRKEIELNGDFSHDARAVLIVGWPRAGLARQAGQRGRAELSCLRYWWWCLDRSFGYW